MGIEAKLRATLNLNPVFGKNETVEILFAGDFDSDENRKRDNEYRGRKTKT